MINTKCALFIEETAHILAQYFLHKNGENKEIKELNKTLEIINNRSDGNTEKYVGKLKFFENKSGELQIETDRNWLKQNKVFSLPTENNYILSTSYGLLYLRMMLYPKLEGELFQYQTIKDSYHMTQKPILYFKEKN